MNGLINNIQLIISLIQIQFNIFMKSLTTYINEKMVYNKSTANKIKYNYYPKTKEELKKLIIQLVEERGNEGDFNDIDTSEITDMSELFLPKFNGDISEWDVSNVTDMCCMFYDCESFNQPLNNWNVSNVIIMDRMFCGCKSFNQPLNKWNVSNVTNIRWMFDNCKSFNQDISNWDVSNVRGKIEMFDACPIEEKYKPKFKK